MRDARGGRESSKRIDCVHDNTSFSWRYNKAHLSSAMLFPLHGSFISLLISTLATMPCGEGERGCEKEIA
jgi:hypothetical protein